METADRLFHEHSNLLLAFRLSLHDVCKVIWTSDISSTTFQSTTWSSTASLTQHWYDCWLLIGNPVIILDLPIMPFNNCALVQPLVSQFFFPKLLSPGLRSPWARDKWTACMTVCIIQLPWKIGRWSHWLHSWNHSVLNYSNVINSCNLLGPSGIPLSIAVGVTGQCTQSRKDQFDLWQVSSIF